MIKFLTQFSIVLFFSFTALQANAQTVNSQSFDGTTFLPSGWTVSGTKPDSLKRVTSGNLPVQAPHSGAGELKWCSYNVQAGNTGDLITPMFDLSGRGSC